MENICIKCWGRGYYVCPGDKMSDPYSTYASEKYCDCSDGKSLRRIEDNKTKTN